MYHYVIFQLTFPLKFSCSTLLPNFTSDLNQAVSYRDLDSVFSTLQMLNDDKVNDLYVGIVSESGFLISYISASDLVSFCIHSKLYCDCEILGVLDD